MFSPFWERQTRADEEEHPCRSASGVVASAAFAASAVAWPARVALAPFDHCLLSCNEKERKKKLSLCSITQDYSMSLMRCGITRVGE